MEGITRTVLFSNGSNIRNLEGEKRGTITAKKQKQIMENIRVKCYIEIKILKPIR